MLTGTLPFNFQNGASFDDVGTNFSRSWWIFALKMFHNTHNIPSQKQHAVHPNPSAISTKAIRCNAPNAVETSTTDVHSYRLIKFNTSLLTDEET